MKKDDLEKLAQEIIDRIDTGTFSLDPFMKEKAINQKTIQDAYQIIKEKYANYIAEYAVGGNIYRIYKTRI